eukprot:50213_1
MVMNLSNGFVIIFGTYMMYLIWTRMGKIRFNIKSMCSAVILLFIAAEVQWIMHVTSSVICDDNGNIFGFQMWLDLGLVALLFYQIGLAVLYLVFVYRLSKAFKGTPLALSQVGFIFFIIFISYHGQHNYKTDTSIWKQRASELLLHIMIVE